MAMTKVQTIWAGGAVSALMLSLFSVVAYFGSTALSNAKEIAVTKAQLESLQVNVDGNLGQIKADLDYIRRRVDEALTGRSG